MNYFFKSRKPKDILCVCWLSLPLTGLATISYFLRVKFLRIFICILQMMKILGIILFVFYSVTSSAQPPEFLGSRNIKDPIWILDDVIISQKRFQKADSLKVKKNIEKINVYKSGDETTSVFGSPVETGIVQLITKKSILKTKPINKQQLNKKYKLEADSPIYVNGYLLSENFSIDKRSVHSIDVQMLNYDGKAHFVLNVFVEPKTSKNSYVYKCGLVRGLESLKTEPVEFSEEDMGKCFYVCIADEGNYYLRVTPPKFGFTVDTISKKQFDLLPQEQEYTKLV